MSHREFVEWQIYYRLAPFGPSRDEAHADVIARTIADVAYGLGGGTGKRPELSDFALTFGKGNGAAPKTKQTPEQMMRLCRMMHKSMGGK